MRPRVRALLASLAAAAPDRHALAQREAHRHADLLARAAGGELEVPERFTLRPDGWARSRSEGEAESRDSGGPRSGFGWDVDITLPLGLAQRDVFTLTPDGDGTKVHIEVDVWPRTFAGRLARPAFMLYARRSYPRTWRAAVKWCEKATS